MAPNTSDQEMVNERVAATRKRLEDIDPSETDPLDELDILGEKIMTDLETELREITLVLATGGPHIELDLYNETVTVSWGSDSSSQIVQNDELFARLTDFYEEQWRVVSS